MEHQIPEIDAISCNTFFLKVQNLTTIRKGISSQNGLRDDVTPGYGGRDHPLKALGIVAHYLANCSIPLTNDR